MIKNGIIKETDNKVIWESDPLPNEVVAVRKGMSPEMAKRIQDAFTAITNEPIAKQLPYPYTGYIPATDEPYQILVKMGLELGALKP